MQMEQRRHLDGMVAEQQSARRQQYERELHNDHHHARRAALDAEAEAMHLQARTAGQQAQQRAMLDEQMRELERRRWLEQARNSAQAKLMTPYERQMNKQLLHQINYQSVMQHKR